MQFNAGMSDYPKLMQEVDGHRLKMWGLELIDMQELGATFRRLSGEMGLCIYSKDSVNTMNPQLISQWLQLDASCPETAGH